MIELLRKIANRLFISYFAKNQHYFYKLKKDYLAARINIPFESYLSLMFFLTFLSFFVTFILVFLYMYFSTGVLHIVEWVVAIFVAAIASVSVFIYFYLYPSLRASDLKQSIENNLPFALIYMAALARAGIHPQKIFEILSRRKEFEGMSFEAKYITNLMKILGYDIITACLKTAEVTPSQKFKMFLYSFVSTIKSGGDLRLFLEMEARERLLEFRLKLREFEDKLSVLVTTYTALFVAFPLLMISILSVLSVMFGTMTLLVLTKYLFISTLPLFHLAFLYYIHTIQPKI